MYRGLVTDLLKYEKITTTEPKAKEIRIFAERMITLGKKGNLEARRRALAFVYSEDVVNKVFSEIAPRYAGRNGGYTRVTKLGMRVGDGAPMAKLELVK
jgi:large subunit ribosomal protein L17